MAIKNNYILGEHLTNPSKKIEWNPELLNNPHLMIVGQSGSGKTYLLKKIISYLDTQKIKTFVIDFHGDIITDKEQKFEFSMINPKYGIGVFEFEMDEKKGGVYNRINDLIQIFKGSFFDMSSLREAVLKKLLYDVYYQKGYIADDPSTWSKPLSELPTLEDLKKLISDLKEILNTKKKEPVILSDNLKQLNNLTEAAFTEDINDKTEKEKEKITEEFLSKSEKIFQEFQKELVNNLNDSTSQKDINALITKRLNIKDFSIYQQKNVLSSIEGLEIYIDSMIEAKIFQQHNPIPDKTKNTFRFDLSFLTDNVMFFTANLIVQRIFTKARQTYKPGDEHKKGIRTYIVIDESKLVMPTGKDKENPFHFLNRIVSESRKFGLGVILVSQRINHYSEEMLTNIAAKLILKVSNNDKTIAKNKLGIDTKMQELLNSRDYGIAVGNFNNKEVVPILLDGAKR